MTESRSKDLKATSRTANLSRVRAVNDNIRTLKAQLEADRNRLAETRAAIATAVAEKRALLQTADS